MREKIAEIRKEMQAASIEELPDFIRKYQTDERAGVRALILQAERKKDAWEKELLRLEKMCVYEKKYESWEYLCGIDEAGRGPLAGPVVAGAVILPFGCRIPYLNDSKQLSAKKREELYDIIKKEAVGVGVGIVGPERIDEINILQATYEAMRQAIDSLPVKPDLLLNDAVTIPGVAIRQEAIIGGDGKSLSIAAASVVAKVTRDRLMSAYEDTLPGYGFASNKGYGSAAHIAALKRLGPSPIHRRSFIGNFL